MEIIELSLSQMDIDTSWSEDRDSLTGCLIATSLSRHFPGQKISCGAFTVNVGDQEYWMAPETTALVQQWCDRRGNSKPQPTNYRLSLEAAISIVA